MKFYDLKEKPSKAESVEKPYYPSLYIDQKQVPELSDYELGDTVEFHIKAKVVSENKREGEEKSLGLEMQKAGIINLKKIRQDAEEMGLSVEQVKEVNSVKKK